MTLRFTLGEIDRLMGEWPTPQTVDGCRPIAHAAVANLGWAETWWTLWAGPQRWRSGRTGDLTVEALPARLRILLETAVATSLSELFTKWVETDIRQLEDRYREVVEAEKEAEAKRKAEVIERSKAVRKRRTREEMDADRIGPQFNPPPRT